MSLESEIVEAMKNGESHPAFIEKNRLLEADNDLQIKFDAEMQRIYSRIMQANFGDIYPEVRFGLQVSDDQNAGVFTGFQPPLIMFSSSLINAMQNESEIAAVLCHELGHQKLQDLIGEHNNGKLEELGSDVQSVVMLRNANYPQDSLIKAFGLMESESVKNILETVQSVHPDTPNRIRALETTVVAINKNRGTQSASSIEDSPNNGILYDIAQSATYESHMDKFFKDNGFDQASDSEKLKIIGKAVIEELAPSDFYFSNRRDEINQRLASIDLSNQHETLETEINDFIQTIITIPDDLDSSWGFSWDSVVRETYKTLQKSYLDEDDWRFSFTPIGIFADFQAKINDFVAADNQTSIEQSAAELITMLKELSGGETKRIHLINNFTLNGFSLPKYDEIKDLSSPIPAPWEQHLKVAMGQKNQDVLQALSMLEVNDFDKRVPKLDDNNVGLSKDIRLSIKSSNLENEKGKTLNYVFDEQGQITGAKARYFDVDDAKQLIKQQAKISVIQEIDELEKVDWSLLKTDFNGFMKQYSARIIRLDYEDSEYPFAKQFVKELREIMQSDDRGIIEDDVKKYFSHIYAEERSGDNKTDNTLFSETLSRRREYNNSADLGFSVDNPLIQFILTDEFELFKPIEKLQLLSIVRTGDLDSWKVDNTLIYEELPKNTLADFREWLEVLKDDVNQQKTQSILSGGFSPEINTLKIKNLLRNEVIKSLENEDQTLTTDDLMFLRSVNNMRESSSDFKQKLAILIGERFNGIEENISNEDLIAQYKILSTRIHMFPSVIEQVPELRSFYQDEIISRIDSATNENKMDLLEDLFFKQEISPDNHSIAATNIGFIDDTIHYNAKIIDPEFRKWATFSYAESLVDHLGQDNGGIIYADKLNTSLQKLQEKCSEANAQEIISQMSKTKLGNKLQLQPHTTEIVAEINQNILLGSMLDNNINAALGEGGLKAITKYKATRDSLINFLTRPFSESSSEQYINESENSLKNDYSIQGFLKEDLTKQSKSEQTQMLHANFWDMPFEARIVVTDLILFPPEDSRSNDPKNIKNVLQDVFNIVLPIHQDNASEGRQIVESYVEACDDIAHQRLLVSSMIAAKEPSKSNSEKNLDFGDALNLVLDALGPAGRKLAQAIESHPQTPQDIKESLTNSKTMAIDPKREDITALIKLYEPKNPEDEIAYVGEVLGAGSYGVTVKATKQSGEETAITFLQPNVREKARDEFERLEKAVDILSIKNNDFEPLKEMVRQAKEMSLQETDMDLAAKQGEVAAKLYDNVEIKVNDETFQFGAAKFLSHGAEYKEFEIIAGKHFNDIAKDDDQDKAHVRNLATAQLVLELSHMLSGRPFDHDRHGGQQKIDGNYIGEFDFGAMGVTQSSPRQKQLIGHVMAGAIIQSHLKGEDFSKSLDSEIEKCANNDQERDFIAKLKRGVLALGNFQGQVGGIDELKPIIGAIYAAGQIEEDILNAMSERAGKVVSTKIFQELEKAGKSSGITISIPEHQFDKSNDNSPLCDPPKDKLFEKLPITKGDVLGAGAGITLVTAGAGTLVIKPDKQSTTKQTEIEQTASPATKINPDGAKHTKQTKETIITQEQPQIREPIMNNGNHMIEAGGITSIALGSAILAKTAHNHVKRLSNRNAENAINSDDRHI
jgi:Peptidase family M48/ABC1 atypical kinase-like domain